MTEQEYRDLPNSEYFSSSFLKDFDSRGPKALIQPKVYDNSGIRFGSLADILLLSSGEFEDDYHITKFTSNFPKTAQQLFDIVSEKIKEDDEFTEDDIINESEKFVKLCLDIISEEKLWSTTKDEEKLKKHFLNDEFKGSLIDSIIAKTKKLVSTEDYMKAQLMAKVIREHEFTKDFINSDDLSKKQVLFQTAIIYDDEGNKFKCLIDIILIDHESKTARVIDYKTGALPKEDFTFTFFKFRYDLQGALYTKALNEFLQQKGFKDYTILNPVFLYTCVSEPEAPLPVIVSKDIIDSAFKGFISRTGRVYKGISQLVDEILWHRKHDKYEYSKQVYERKYDVINNNFISRSFYAMRSNDSIPNYRDLNTIEELESDENNEYSDIYYNRLIENARRLQFVSGTGGNRISPGENSSYTDRWMASAEQVFLDDNSEPSSEPPSPSF